MSSAIRRRALDKAWEDAVLLLVNEWTVSDHNTSGLDAQQIATAALDEVASALTRLEGKGLLAQ